MIDLVNDKRVAWLGIKRYSGLAYYSSRYDVVVEFFPRDKVYEITVYAGVTKAQFEVGEDVLVDEEKFRATLIGKLTRLKDEIEEKIGVFK